MAESGQPKEFRLWDSQWANIVNHADGYAGLDKEDAIAMAVRLTEQAMAKNFFENSFPPAPTSQP